MDKPQRRSSETNFLDRVLALLAFIIGFWIVRSVRKGGLPQVDLIFCFACLFDNRQRAADTLTW